MKLKFKSVSLQNFLKYGAVPTTIILDNHKVTYIGGANGQGKSSISDAICFAISNRAYRPIPKPLLVNSINRKNCRVELVFEKDNDEYKIIRGIKPNIFEIYKNSELFNPPTDSRDYQQVLEDQILGGFSFKSFAQVVMLGSAGYEPFLELKPEARRDVVETILDIGIFSEMNEKNKALLTKLKQAEREASIKVREKEAALSSLENISKSLEDDIEGKRSAILAQIDTLAVQLTQVEAEIETNQQAILSLNEKVIKFGNVQGKLSKFEAAKSMLNNRVNTISNDVSRYDAMDTCQACMQPVGDDHKQYLIQDLKTKQEAIVGELHRVSGNIDILTDANQKLNKLNVQTVQHSNMISKLNGDRRGYVASKVALEQQLLQLSKPKNVDDVSSKVMEAKVILDQSKSEYNSIAQELAIATAASKLLNDSGVKANIIGEYLPILNHFINENLDKMNLFVNITLDESFDVTFKARHRDEFSFYSFSEGEKARINIAILFAWRDLAKAKNSINTNLLILDELFSSAVDSTGLEQLQDLLLSMDDVNIFVMSHSSVSMCENFADRTLTMSVENNFTRVDES